MNTDIIRTQNIEARRVELKVAYDLTLHFRDTQRYFRITLTSIADYRIEELPGENTPLEGDELRKAEQMIYWELRPSSVYHEHLYRLANPDRRDPSVSDVPAQYKGKKEWVKTYEEACQVVGTDPVALPDVSMLPAKHRKSVIAYIKLVTIIEALNEGWVPDFGKASQNKYFPFFVTQRQMNGDVNIVYKDHFESNGYVDINSRLFLRTIQLARYVGQNFSELYHEYLMY